MEGSTRSLETDLQEQQQQQQHAVAQQQVAAIAHPSGMWQVLEQAPANLLHHPHPPPNHHFNGGPLLHPGAAAAGMNQVNRSLEHCFNSSLNLMIRGGGQGLIPALSSPSNPSNSLNPPGATQYLLLGPHGAGVDPNNLSPGSGGNPGLPPPSVTPPNHAGPGLDLGGERAWAANNQSLFLGSQILGHEALATQKSLEEAAAVAHHAARLKQQQAVGGPQGGDFLQAQQQQQQQHHTLESLHGLRGNPGGDPRYSPYNPYDLRNLPPNASSPPVSSGVLRPMPPRPRPEGGQEQSSGFESLGGNGGVSSKQDDFSIGPWDEESVVPPSNGQPLDTAVLKYPREIRNLQAMSLLHPPLNGGNTNGSNPPGSPNPPPFYNIPQQQQKIEEKILTCEDPGADQQQQHLLWNPPPVIQPNNNYHRGNKPRKVAYPVRVNAPPNVADLLEEKREGKKSAIAETIAMMSKMKMEDKARAAAHKAKNPTEDVGAVHHNNREEYTNHRYNQQQHHRGQRRMSSSRGGGAHFNTPPPPPHGGGYLPRGPPLEGLFSMPPFYRGGGGGFRGLYRGPPPPIMLGYPHHRLHHHVPPPMSNFMDQPRRRKQAFRHMFVGGRFPNASHTGGGYHPAPMNQENEENDSTEQEDASDNNALEEEEQEDDQNIEEVTAEENNSQIDVEEVVFEQPNTVESSPTIEESVDEKEAMAEDTRVEENESSSNTASGSEEDDNVEEQEKERIEHDNVKSEATTD